MALLNDHIELANALHSDMKSAHEKGEWPIAVDAGFYTVFHGMEAVNAVECRDTYSFADAADVLETILVERGFGEEFASDYRYLFYFRRGALYGAHVPSKEQMAEYVRRAEKSFSAVQSYLNKFAA
jgi:uncharacterized protein (UPF0332 family)